MKENPNNVQGLVLEDGQYQQLDFFRWQQEEKRKTTKEAVSKRKSKNILHMALDEWYGVYYFSRYMKLINKIKENYLFRFIYLCTFMDFDGKIRYGNAKGDNGLAKEKDLQEIFRLSVRETLNTKKILLDKKLISFNENSEIQVNTSFCKRGKLTKSFNKECIRMFDKAIQEIYDKATTKEHGKLGLLVKILPMINYRWNMVCENPEHMGKMGDMKPLNLTQLAKILGFSTTQKLRSALFDVEVAGEKVIMVCVIDRVNMILVNPRFYYAGNSIEDLEYLKGLFDIANNQLKK